MRISKINSFVLPKAINNKEVKKHDNIQNNFNIQNSSNAIKSYALSQITFKGEDRVFYQKDPQINEYRQQVYDKYKSGPKFYENDENRSEFILKQGIELILRQSEADAKIALLDKYANDKKWNANNFIQEEIGHIFIDIKNTSLVDFIDKVLSAPDLAESKEMQELIMRMPFQYDGRGNDVYDAKLAVLNKFLSEPKLTNNKELNENFIKILKNTHTEEAAQAKIQIMDKYLNDSRWNENEKLNDLFIDIINSVDELPETDARNSVIDTLLETSLSPKNKRDQQNITQIISAVRTKPQAKVGKKMLCKEFVSMKDLTSTACTCILKGYDICSDEKADEVADAKIELLDKILSNTALRNNKSIQKNMIDILNFRFYDFHSPKEYSKSRLSVMKKYLSNKDLQQIQGINDILGRIIEKIDDSSAAEFINCIFSDKNIYEDEWFQRKLHSITYAHAGIGPHYNSRIDIMQRLEDNQEKYDIKNVEKLLKTQGYTLEKK